MEFDFDKPGQVIRVRRMQRGLSQADLARHLGKEKSFISMVESGARPLSHDDAGVLASVLDLPEELLRLATGGLPEDVEKTLPQRAALVTTAVRQAAEEYALRLGDGLDPEWRKRLGATHPVKPGAGSGFEGTIRAGKNSTTYRAHSYHTKVPPEAIVPLIEHYTRPGDVVLDPFCGSGMTGVAALRVGRHALLSDVSPAAVHISRNYVTPCDPNELVAAGERVHRAVRSTMAFLYDAVESTGARATVEHTVWSDVYSCPSCREEWTFWEATAQVVGREAGKLVRCPRCRACHRKSDLTWVREAPVVSSTSSDAGGRQDKHDLTAAELDLIAQAQAVPIPYWTPQAEFVRGREMWRASHEIMGIRTVSGFYTRRNLYALAALRHAILQEPDLRLRNALLFAFTGCVNRASRRYQWNEKRPTNVMTGTLYISSLRYEWNVWSLFRRKLADAVRFYEEFPKEGALAEVVMASATHLGHVPDHSIDFVFMDPPFGSNIFYGDSSLLWEGWLGRLTPLADEIVVNQSVQAVNGGKSVARYSELLRECFAEVHRVLKPNARAILAFSNTDDAVWEAIRAAIEGAGFEVENTAVLDKVHHSIKGVQGALGNERVTRLDLLITLRSRAGAAAADGESRAVSAATLKELVTRCVEESTTSLATDHVYTSIMQSLIQGGGSVQGVSMADVERALGEVATRSRAGRWQGKRPTPKRAYRMVESPYGCMAEEYLRLGRSFELQAERYDPLAVRHAPAGTVPGSRNTALYNAHSYHTKVPPEAIAPFIEHFTRPGDIVLDPFSGTGMTGVAAALAGRRCVLNDLSLIGTHLAFNHTRPCDPDLLRAEFDRLYASLLPSFREIYRTDGPNGERGYVHYTMWSKVYVCKTCQHRFTMWSITDAGTGRVGSLLRCPKCGFEASRQSWRAEGNEPVLVNFEIADTHKRQERPISDSDRKLIASFNVDNIKTWFPSLAISADREMYIRSALHLQGVKTIADFYTARNLLALSTIWEAIQRVADPRVRSALAFGFTNTAWHGTKMRRFNARGGQRPLTGTLYIPQLSSEVNVLEVLKNKIAQLCSYYQAFRPDADVPAPIIQMGSATNLAGVPDESVDYVFTDPPFGSNIFYADCNLIWESWLGGVTDDTLEAVVNRSRTTSSGGKTVGDYQRLMTAALQEMKRVLKPNGWLTLVFHNTDADVWKALQDASAEAGFRVDGAAGLDRQQQSHKGYKGRSGEEDVAHFDVVLSMQKTGAGAARKSGELAVTDNVLRDRLVLLSASDERIATSVQWAHSAIIRLLIAENYDLSDVSFERVRAVLASGLPVQARARRKRASPSAKASSRELPAK